MKRIWHRYEKWEDLAMWRRVTVKEESQYLQAAIQFTSNAELYGSWMIKVTELWPISCEHNLTNTSTNQRAWIGHAATQMAIKCPEYITRKAWGNLLEYQREAANKKADEAILIWQHTYQQS